MKNVARRTEITVETHEITVFRFHSKHPADAGSDCRTEPEILTSDEGLETNAAPRSDEKGGSQLDTGKVLESLRDGSIK